VVGDLPAAGRHPAGHRAGRGAGQGAGAGQIAASPDDRFRLLTGGSRTALPRQQTLRALDRLELQPARPEERRCCRLSVFAGGWTLEAAETVCAGPDLIESYEVLDILTGLVDKSLVH
jgi:predicted ATPase